MPDASPPSDRGPAGPVGLCSTCHHAQIVRSRRSAYLRCSRSDQDPGFERYPRLPVLECRGYEVDPEAGHS